MPDILGAFRSGALPPEEKLGIGRMREAVLDFRKGPLKEEERAGFTIGTIQHRPLDPVSLLTQLLTKRNY